MTGQNSESRELNIDDLNDVVGGVHWYGTTLSVSQVGGNGTIVKSPDRLSVIDGSSPALTA